MTEEVDRHANSMVNGAENDEAASLRRPSIEGPCGARLIWHRFHRVPSGQVISAMSAKFTFAAAFILALLLGSAGVRADYDRPVPGVPDKHGVIYDKPIYDPDSKRYFALIWAHDPANNYLPTTWGTAYNQALTREYKGVRGRLAIVDTLEVHSFLERTFHPNVDAWIGLRYWCGGKMLQWADGKTWAKGGFQAWDANWKQDVYACNSGDGKGKEYMPIAYSAVDQGFRWIGKGWHKGYFAYFVEFPTGEP